METLFQAGLIIYRMQTYIYHMTALTLDILMDFPIHIDYDTISMGLPIVYFKGSQVAFSKL